MNKGWAAAALAGGMMLAAAAAAMTAETFSDTAQQARYRSLLKELRCMVCQNQALDDSNAELAADMRRVVANMVRNGNSDSDIKEFMTGPLRRLRFVSPPPSPRNRTPVATAFRLGGDCSACACCAVEALQFVGEG